MYLTREGFGVHVEYDGSAGLAAARKLRPVACVLDIGLPGLTGTEFDLLAHLLHRPGRVYTREELLASVWGYAAHAGTRTVDVHVAQVRAKLGASGSVIRTVRGVGYTADA